MPLVAKVRSLVKNLFERRGLNADLDEEIDAQLNMLIEEKVSAGMPPEDARRAARIELEGVEQLKQKVRDERAGEWLFSVFSDLRYGFRQLHKEPGFACAAILTLALAIGANTIIFSVVWRPMRYQDANRLMMVWETRPDGSRSNVSARTYLDWRDQNASFEHLAAARMESIDLAGDPPALASGAYVTPNFFETIRLQPELGRFFSADDAAPSGEKVVVLSHEIWKSHFGGDPEILGKTARLNGERYRVVGVAPVDFEFMGRVDLWLPMALAPGETNRQARDLLVVGRLKRGIGPAEAAGQMRVLAERIAEQSPETNRKWGALTQNFYEAMAGPGVLLMLLQLLVTVGIVLVMACANVANLLLARGATRQKEIAVRIALGASRWRIVRQLLLETLLLAVVSGAMGLLLAIAATRYLATLPILQAPGLAPIEINWEMLAFAALLSVAATVLSGVAPAWLTSAASPLEHVKASGPVSIGDRRQGWICHALAVADLALSLALMVAAGLSLRGLIHLVQTDPGFGSKGLLTAHLSLPESRYGNSARIKAFYSELLTRVRGIPGVEDAAICTELPPSRFATDHPFQIEGIHAAPAASTAANYQVISGDFFSTLGLPLLKGRGLSDDDRQGATGAAVVNERFAEEFFPAGDAVGSRLLIKEAQTDGGAKDQTALEIIGIVKGLKSSGLNEPTHPQIYTSYLQAPTSGEYLVVRGAVEPEQLAGAIGQVVRAMDPDLPLTDVSTMDERLSRAFVGKRFVVSLLVIFALMALVMDGAGLYGVISYSASRRMPEFALRLALGASRREIFRLIANGALRLLLIGGGIGAFLVLAVTRVLSRMIFGISPYDPITLTTVSLVLLAVVIAASYIPARRAMKVDPLTVLRYE